MKTIYGKHYSSPSQIIRILKSRGLAFENETEAESYLRHIGYHKLSAYAVPFYRNPKESKLFKDGTSFGSLISLYTFDKKLRVLLFDEIGSVEVAVRCIITNAGCEELGDDHWITDSSHFADSHKFGKTLQIIEREISSSNDDYIAHFRRHYTDNYPPAWVITEILSFGTLNGIYSNISDYHLRKRISSHFGVMPKVLTSWLTAMSTLRNMCCHHTRVWNRHLAICPAVPANATNPWIDSSRIDRRRLYYRLCIIKFFLNAISPGNDMRDRLSNLFGSFPNVDLAAMGFPEGWISEPLWMM